MKSLFSIEMYKLWSKKGFLMILALMFTLNLSLFAYTQHQNEIPLQAYKTLQNKLFTLPNEMRYAYICDYNETIQKHYILQQILLLEGKDDQKSQQQIDLLRSQYPDLNETTSRDFFKTAIYYSGSLEKEVLFMQEVQKEMDQLHHYHNYLAQIQQKANEISSSSIFSKPTSFSAHNIKKTAQDFQGMDDIVIEYQLQIGIKEAIHFPLTDVLIILIVGVIAATIILEEKEKRLFSIIKPTVNGGRKTIQIKCSVMILSSIIPIILLYASNLIYMEIFCGLGHLHASLQSLAQYAQNTLHLSIGGYLILFLLTKWMAAIMIGAFMMLITLFSRHRVFCFGGMFLLLGSEFLLYQSLPHHQVISILRHINLISFLRTDVFYEMYYNVNLFSQAYSLQKLSQIFMILLALILFTVIILTYMKKQNLQMNPLEWIHQRKKKHIIPSLWIQESYKIFWIQKGIWIILFFGWIQFYSFSHPSIYVSLEEKSYMQYIEILQGKPSEKTDQFIASQEEHYHDLHLQQEKNQEAFMQGHITKAQLDQMQSYLDSQLYGEAIFQRVVEQYTYVKEEPHREMMIPFGYQRLLFDTHFNLIPALFSILCITLIFSNLLCIEYPNRTDRLLLACQKGGKSLRHYKLCIALCTTIFLTLFSYFADISHIILNYGYQGLGASITSLPELSFLPPLIPLLGLILLLFLLKLLAVCSVIFLLFALSKWFRQQAQVIFLLLMITAVPIILHIMGIYILDGISLYPLLCSGILIKNGQWLQIIFSMIVYISLSIGCYRQSIIR